MAGTKISAATVGAPAVTTDRLPIYRVGQSASDKFYLTVASLLASPALTGSPTAPTQSAGDNSTKIATTAYVDALSLTISTGLTNTAGTLTVNLSTGVSGGQSVIGGTASGNSLTLSSTTHATKGTLILGSTIYDEVNNYWKRSYISQSATTGTVESSFKNTAAAHTSLTTAVARVENDFVGATQQWVAGTVGTQIMSYFRGFTLSGASATAQFTNGYNVFIDDLTAGTNATITNRFALGLGGNVNFTTAATIRGGSSLDISSFGGTYTLRTGSLGDSRQAVTTSGIWTHPQSTFTTGTPNWFTYTGAPHTTLNASAEFVDFNWNLAQTKQFSTGALSLQRSGRWQAATYSFTGASTLTRAVAFSYSGPPKAGTNATITTSIGVEVETRDVSGGSGVGTGYGAFFNAPTGATTNYAVGTAGNVVLTTAGTNVQIKEGTNGMMGQTTLVGGTKAITINGVTTGSRAFVQLVSPSGTAVTVTYQAVCTANTLTIQANVAAGTINTSDGSTLNYIVYNQAA